MSSVGSISKKNGDDNNITEYRAAFGKCWLQANRIDSDETIFVVFQKREKSTKRWCEWFDRTSQGSVLYNFVQLIDSERYWGKKGTNQYRDSSEKREDKETKRQFVLYWVPGESYNEEKERVEICSNNTISNQIKKHGIKGDITRMVIIFEERKE